MKLPTAIRTIAVSAAALALPFAVLTPTAHATPTLYLISNNALLEPKDPGIGNPFKGYPPVAGAAYASFSKDTSGQATYDGHTTYKFRLNGGTDCMQASSNLSIYDEGCNTNGTNQQFYLVDDYIYSVGLQNIAGSPVAIQTASANSGATLVGSSNTTKSNLNQWTFTPVETNPGVTKE
jgi:hypothetical protein